MKQWLIVATCFALSAGAWAGSYFADRHFYAEAVAARKPLPQTVFTKEVPLQEEVDNCDRQIETAKSYFKRRGVKSADEMIFSAVQTPEEVLAHKDKAVLFGLCAENYGPYLFIRLGAVVGRTVYHWGYELAAPDWETQKIVAWDFKQSGTSTTFSITIAHRDPWWAGLLWVFAAAGISIAVSAIGIAVILKSNRVPDRYRPAR